MYFAALLFKDVAADKKNICIIVAYKHSFFHIAIKILSVKF
jgi:hypothetical protein